MSDDDKKKKASNSTIIYKVPGQHRGPAGTTYSSRGAKKGDKVPKGWHSTLEAAVEAYSA